MPTFPPFRWLLLPALLTLLGLAVLTGCGALETKKTPTSATTATLGGVQALTDALYDAAMPSGSPAPTVPLSAAPQGPAGTSEAADFTRSMMAGLGAVSQPLLATVTFTDFVRICRDGGSVTLNGSATVDDQRDVNGFGLVRLTVSNLTTSASGCTGHGYQVTGSTTLNVDNTVSRTYVDPSVNHWTLTRDETGSGTLAITRVTDNVVFNVTYSWSRRGTIALDYDHVASQVAGSVSVNQTVGIAVNGQSCTGTLTAATLFGGYNWVCTGQ